MNNNKGSQSENNSSHSSQSKFNEDSENSNNIENGNGTKMNQEEESNQENSAQSPISTNQQKNKRKKPSDSHQKYIYSTSSKNQKGARNNQRANNLKRKADEKNQLQDKKEKKVQITQTKSQAVVQPPVVQSNIAQLYLYKPETLLPDLSPLIGQIIEIRIAKKYISRNNKMVNKRQIWGSDMYTSNSDAVCILIHSGKAQFDCREITDQKYEGVSLQLKVQRQKKTYQSALKNGILSRTNKKYNGNSLKAETITWLNSLGKQQELQEAASRMCILIGKKRIKQQFIPRYSQIVPIPEVNIVFNMNNDPAYKFSITNICDKSSEYKTWTSYKLKTQVLYLDTANERYEISKIENEIQNEEDEMFNDCDIYRIAKVLEPLDLDNTKMSQISKPLDQQYIEVMYNEISWEKLLWGSNSIQINSPQSNSSANNQGTKQIEDLRSFKFYPIQKII